MRFRDRLSVGEPLEDVGVGLDLAATRNPCGQPTTSTVLFGCMEFNFLGIVAGLGLGHGLGLGLGLGHGLGRLFYHLFELLSK